MFKETPVESIVAALASLAIQPQDIIISTATDIDRLGRYSRQWLIVTAERLVVVAEAAPPEVLLDLTIAEVSEFRCQSVIGSGLLQARMDSLFVDILRYSNGLADKFGKTARKLEYLRKGEPVTFDPEEEVDPRRCAKCGMMLGSVGETCPRCIKRGAVLVRMVGLMRPYLMAASLIMVFLVFGIILDLVSPMLTRYLVDNVLPGSQDAVRKIGADPSLFRRLVIQLLMVVGILALVQILRMGVNIVNGRLGSRIGTAITFDMRGRLMAHLQQLSIGYYDRQQVGSLVGRVAYDTEALHGFVGQLTGGFLFQLLMVLFVGAMMFYINSKLAFFTLIPAPLVMAGSFVFWRHIYPRYYRFWDASSKQAGMISGTLSGIRVVKVFAQEDREIQRFNAASDHLRKTRRNVDMATATFNPIMGLVFQFGGWIVWFVGGRDVLGGEMTLGSLMAFFGYLWMFYGPLATLTQFTNWLTSFATQAHRIFEILDTPEEITESQNPVSLKSIQGAIEFDRVTFGYNRHTPILHDLSLKIEPGEMIGVVGRSGSGKTTVVNLISRFYDVEEGRVLIDGHDVRAIAKNDLRRQIGVVLQEPFLFRGSLWQNLIYGKPEATPQEVIAASKAANAHDFIMRMPHGYDTWVGERGAGLSGGERQRISISRVLLTDPRILILDEATSSVDAESEAAIQAALAEVVRGRTTIAIAHRLSTLRNANRIIVVDDGKVAESGSHEELLGKDGGVYAHLIKIQGQMMPPSVERLAQEAKDKTGEKEEEALASHHPNWLSPKTSHIHLGNMRALHVTIVNEGIWGGVYALRCMPVHHPDRYISLRYLNPEKREVELGLIRDLSEWPVETQRLVREALLKRYFVHTVLSIESIESFTGYLLFKVETDLGPREFMLRYQGHRAQDYGHGGKMLIDTEENRFLIPEVEKMPERDRRLFQRYIYW